MGCIGSLCLAILSDKVSSLIPDGGDPANTSCATWGDTGGLPCASLFLATALCLGVCPASSWTDANLTDPPPLRSCLNFSLFSSLNAVSIASLNTAWSSGDGTKSLSGVALLLCLLNWADDISVVSRCASAWGEGLADRGVTNLISSSCCCCNPLISSLLTPCPLSCSLAIVS